MRRKESLHIVSNLLGACSDVDAHPYSNNQEQRFNLITFR